MTENLLEYLVAAHEMQEEDEKLSELIIEFEDKYDPESMDVWYTYRQILNKHNDLNIAIETAIE